MSKLLEMLNNKQMKLDKKIIEGWNNLIIYLRNDPDIRIEELNPQEAYKFRFDFVGLLKEKFNVPDNSIYPNIILNGLKSPTEYNGLELKIKILRRESLLKYEKMMRLS